MFFIKLRFYCGDGIRVQRRGNILDEKRSCLTPKALQIQVCVDDWTKAEYRQQEIDQEPTYDFFKDDEPESSGAVEPE
ncbi:hypothetical protein LWI29_001618 [Acer saccharum]|uniref:Uncharacterized protein n=1 Tax=Acer saccharum TaxID=4024 RepID=A0AA39VMF2_ACESA|nr:hypothetical protein LWI29_001618 [Acer saccharum]